MKLSKQRKPTDTGFNMTPMIDIVFLLIIFFMTVSQITRVVDHPVELPTVPQGGSPSEPIALTVNVDQTGNLIVAEKEYELAEFLVFIGEQLAEVNNDPSLLNVRVRCDKRCKSKYVNQIMTELAQLNLSQVRIAIRGER